MEQLDELNYGLLQKVAPQSMRGKQGRFFDHMRRAVQDRFLPIRRTQEAIEAALGRPLNDDENAWVGETLSHGKVRQASFERDHNFRKPIVEAMHNAGLKLDEVDEYLNAHAAPARNAKIAAINPAKPDGGSGMTNQEAVDHLAAVAAGSPDKARALATIRGLVRAMLDDRLNLMVDSGLIDPGTAAQWRADEPEYVPLRGKEGDPDAETQDALSKMRVGRRLMGLRGPLEPRATGRSSRAPDILATTFALADETARRAAKNEVELMLLRLAVEAPDPNVWEVSPVQRQAYMAKITDPVTGAVTRQVRYRNAAYDKREDTMVVRDGGQQVRIRIKDPNLLKAISGLGAGEQHAMLQFLGAITGTLSKMNTLWHPEFALTNAFKDAQAGLINLGVQDIPGLKRAVLKNMYAAGRGTYRYLKTGEATDEWTRLSQEARRAGLVFGYTHMGNPAEEAKSIEDAIHDLTGGRAWKRGLASIGRVVTRSNESVDSMIRLATYKALRDRGHTQQQAVAVAKSLTVDFDRKGEWGPAMNSLFMFANVGWQGTAILANAIKSRRVQRAVAAIVALGVAQELLSNLWGPPDDEDDDGTGLSVYDRIPEYEKRAAIIIMSGSGPGDYYKIPMPFGYSFFHNTGRLIAAYARGAPEPDLQPVTMAATIGRLAAGFAVAMIPPGMGDLGIPTLATPFTEIMANESYFGRPIQPTKYPGDEKPDSRNYFPNPNWLSLTAAQGLNAITGGDEFKPGLVDVSPESISHVVSVYSGAVGAFALNAINSLTGLYGEATGTAAEDPRLGWRNVPFARKFVGSASPYQVMDITYQRMAAVELLKDRADAKTDEAKIVRREHRRELALVDDARKLRKALSGFRKQRLATLANPKLPAQQQRAQTDRLAEREKVLMRHFNQRYIRAVAPPRASAPPG
jgi:hypothetical protein